MNVTLRGRTRPYRTVTYDARSNTVQLIDQRLLPHEFTVVSTSNCFETGQAIRDMLVRGAGAIGATAAYGLAQGAKAFPGEDLRTFGRYIKEVFELLKSARPTAVDPVNAMLEVLRQMKGGETVAEKQALAVAAAEEFAHEDVEHCRGIGRHGSRLIRNDSRILTHCNAGW